MRTLEERLNEVARIAVRLERESGCPAQLLIAQWAIESKWGAKPTGHANYFGIKHAARHTECCTVHTQEVFTPAQLEAWNRQHPAAPAHVITTLPHTRLCVEVEDEFADYDSLDASCQDYAWLITQGEAYRAPRARYQRDRSLTELISGVARTYATAPQYADLAAEIAGQANVVGAISEANAAAITSAIRFDAGASSVVEVPEDT